jgi:hypothetical protein
MPASKLHTYSSLLDRNTLPASYFKNIYNLDSFLKLRDNVSQPYKTSGKFVSYILIFSMLENKQDDSFITSIS